MKSPCVEKFVQDMRFEEFLEPLSNDLFITYNHL